MSIHRNIRTVHQTIQRACSRSSRDPATITLVAAVKQQSIVSLQAVQQEGLTVFGENTVADLHRHYDAFGGADIQWHFIGHLQTNKIKHVLGKISLLQSLDSIRLAEKLNQQLRTRDQQLDVLIEVNSASEPQKQGIMPDDALSFMKELTAYEQLRVRGLMMMGKQHHDPEQSRPYFHHTYKLFQKLQQMQSATFDTLSMGMSTDYAVAIEEGATMVRVGRALFS